MDMWTGLGDLQAGNSALDIQSQQIPTEICLSDHTLLRNTQRTHAGGGVKSPPVIEHPTGCSEPGRKENTNINTDDVGYANVQSQGQK